MPTSKAPARLGASRPPLNPAPTTPLARRRVHRHLGIRADTRAASIVERRERRVQPADRVNTGSRLGPHHTPARATHEPATLLSFANMSLLIGTGRFAACALAPFAL
jgi:hypothetical protein